MDIIKTLHNELMKEAQITRKFFKLIPFEKAQWAPHEKSMKMLPLATHIADLFSWPKLGLETEGLDFATAPYQMPELENNEQLVAFFESKLKEGEESLSKANEKDLDGRWVLRTGDHIHADMNKYELIRVSLNQITHHRAQLGVYLRLLNIPLPGSYGPSADETGF